MEIKTPSFVLFSDDVELLLEQCRQAGVSQSELAERAGVTQPYVNMVVNKKRAFTALTKRKLWSALNEIRREKKIANFEEESAEMPKLDSVRPRNVILKDAREWFGFSQAEVARQAGVSEELIASIEDGESTVSRAESQKVWDWLNLSAEIIEKSHADTPGLWKRIATEGLNKEPLDIFSIPRLLGMLPPLGKSPADDERIRKIWEENKALLAAIETQAKQIAILTGPNTIAGEALQLLERVQKLEAAYAELCELNNLRTKAIVATAEADERQEQIEQRVKKDKDAV